VVSGFCPKKPNPAKAAYQDLRFAVRYLPSNIENGAQTVIFLGYAEARSHTVSFEREDHESLLIKSALVTIRHNRRETTGWISKFNRVLPERLVGYLKLGLVAIDCHGIRIAIDRDGNLLARVARIGEGKLGLQSVAADIMLAAHLERNQVSAWDAAAGTGGIEGIQEAEWAPGAAQNHRSEVNGAAVRREAGNGFHVLIPAVFDA